jgi:hypothetical protein
VPPTGKMIGYYITRYMTVLDNFFKKNNVKLTWEYLKKKTKKAILNDKNKKNKQKKNLDPC